MVTKLACLYSVKRNGNGNVRPTIQEEGQQEECQPTEYIEHIEDTIISDIQYVLYNNEVSYKIKLDVYYNEYNDITYKYHNDDKARRLSIIESFIIN